MNKRMKGFLMLAMLILGLIFGGSSGCVNAETKDMTPEQKAYYVEDKRIKTREKFVDFIIACHYKGHILFYVGSATYNRKYASVQKDGTVYIPKHHKQYSYKCMYASDVRDMIEHANR